MTEDTGTARRALEALGFDERRTGGDCRAMVLTLPCGGEVVVTDEDGGSLPEWRDWTVGVYPDAEWVPEAGELWRSCDDRSVGLIAVVRDLTA